ncbi:MAG: hypothetical protein ACE5J4_03155 [Candidatus Aenigmatarchaeota archaeon]
MRTLTRIIISLTLAVIISLATGLLSNGFVLGDFPNIRISLEPVIGITYWGYPLYWLKRVVVPDAPYEISWVNLVTDIIIWFIMVFVILKIVKRY